MAELGALRLASERARHVLSGETMGTRWSVIFYAASDVDLDAVGAALQASVDAVDFQMSPWKRDSLVSRLADMPEGCWIDLPDESFAVIEAALAMNAATDGLFDPFLGTAVSAWGFGPEGNAPDQERIVEERELARAGGRAVSFDRSGRRLKIGGKARLDLCGIAKGYGVDRLSETLAGFGIPVHLTSIDGEVRVEGTPPDQNGWTIAIEKPDQQARTEALILKMSDMAVATSGTYRHIRWHEGREVSHTIHPQTGAPVDNSLLSVTVLSDTCMQADALATALMVMGTDRALGFCTRHNIAALMMERTSGSGHRMVPSARFETLIGSISLR